MKKVERKVRVSLTLDLTVEGEEFLPEQIENAVYDVFEDAMWPNFIPDAEISSVKVKQV